MVDRDRRKEGEKKHGQKKGKQRRQEPPISVHLEVQVVERKVIAQLLFRNQTDEPQYLDPNRSGARGVQNAHFRITCDGKKTPYIGPMMLKSRAPNPEEYIGLAPEGEFETKLDITDVYAWLPGKHTYEAYYREYHLNPYKHELYLLQSNVARFTYYKPT